MFFIDSDRPYRVLFWSGSPPAGCDACGVELPAVFVDCKTVMGWWGCLCVRCAGDLAATAGPPLCRVYQASSSGWVSFF